MLSFRGSSFNTLVATAYLVPLRNSRLIFLQRVRDVSVHVLSKCQPSTFITKDSETASLEVVGYRGVKDACRGESRASELHFPVRVVARSSGEPGAPPALSAAPPSSNSRSGWCWLERRARHLSRALRRGTSLQLPVRVEHQLLKISQKITVTATNLNVSHVSLLAEGYETAFQDFPKNSKFLRKFF